MDTRAGLTDCFGVRLRHLAYGVGEGTGGVDNRLGQDAELLALKKNGREQERFYKPPQRPLTLTLTLSLTVTLL